MRLVDTHTLCYNHKLNYSAPDHQLQLPSYLSSVQGLKVEAPKLLDGRAYTEFFGVIISNRILSQKNSIP